MLWDIARKKFEKNIVIPLLHEMEKDLGSVNAYDFYFKKFRLAISVLKGGTISCWPFFAPTSWESFIWFRGLPFRRLMNGENSNKANDALHRYLFVDGVASIHQYILFKDERISPRLKFIGNDEVLYDLIRESWIGERILAISTLKETLTKKYAPTPAEEDDFFH